MSGHLRVCRNLPTATQLQRALHSVWYLNFVLIFRLCTADSLLIVKIGTLELPWLPTCHFTWFEIAVSGFGLTAAQFHDRTRLFYATWLNEWVLESVVVL